MNWLSNKWKAVWKEEKGLGTLEILLIIAVLVVIAVVFRKWIVSWVNQLFTDTQEEIDTIDNLRPSDPPATP
ncbi:Flp1 family type IVb pilin [Marinicrinis sediminis]|uniref:Flp1 family type IVb pilin n=1 Tax=Marinicrinis sediminis TaxID=1652465 RepID=A0ABW5RD97_9BACL